MCGRPRCSENGLGQVPNRSRRCSSRGRIRTFVNSSKVSRPAWLDDPGSTLPQNSTGPQAGRAELPRGTSDAGDAGLAEDQVVQPYHIALSVAHCNVASRHARRRGWLLYAEHPATWRSLYHPSVATYGFVGYGDVSVMISAKLGSSVGTGVRTYLRGPESRARFNPMPASPETVPDRTIPAATPTVTRRIPLPEIEPDPSTTLDRFLVGLFVTIPLLAVLAAIPLAWNLGWLGWHDIVIALVFYVISGMGISMGFHRSEENTSELQ